MMEDSGGRPMAADPLTTKQRRVLRAIYNHVIAFDAAPTVRELGDMLGIASTNGVADHLEALQRKGALTITGGVARGIRLTDAGRNAAVGLDLAFPWQMSEDVYVERFAQVQRELAEGAGKGHMWPELEADVVAELRARHRRSCTIARLEGHLP